MRNHLAEVQRVATHIARHGGDQVAPGGVEATFEQLLCEVERLVVAEAAQLDSGHRAPVLVQELASITRRICVSVGGKDQDALSTNAGNHVAQHAD